MAGNGGGAPVYDPGVTATPVRQVSVKKNGKRPTETINLTQKIGTAEASLYASSQVRQQQKVFY